MADISKELAAIMAAVFGKDVRKSIHDAIEKINEASEKQLDIGTAVTGPTSPSADYMGGSLYINEDTYELWKCTGENSWVSMGIIRGIDGRAISSITLTDRTGAVDTYTIYYSDSTTSTFTVTNGVDGVDGAQWYKGTAITSTGSGLTGYPGKIHDFYLNPTTGYIYQCTKTGDVNTAEWEFSMAITGGSATVTVIDHLNSTSGTDALSANQGRNLNNKKIEKPNNPSNGQLLGFNGTDWVAVDQPEGHEMLPDPTSQAPVTAAAQEAAIVQAVKDGVLDGWDNENVASLNTIGIWSNTATKTFLVQGIAGANTPIGTTGIGTWYDGEDLDDIDPSTDEADWINIADLAGIVTNNDVKVGLVYDPSHSACIALGGYIIDDVTCKMCIKFANEISEDDTHTATVGIELTIRRTAPVAVS